MLNDEKHLVVVRRTGKRLLRAQQTIEAQIIRIALSPLEVAVYPGLEGTRMLRASHIAFPLLRGVRRNLARTPRAQ
jgi:hypothetical protein